MTYDRVRVDTIYHTDEWRVIVWAGDEGSTGSWSIRTVAAESLAYLDDYFTPLFDAAMAARMELEARV